MINNMKFDDFIDDIQAPNLNVIAARPGVGMHTFAINIAEKIYESHKKHVAYFSNNLQGTQLMEHHHKTCSHVNFYAYRFGELSISELIQRALALKQQNELDLLIVELSVLGKNESCTNTRNVKGYHIYELSNLAKSSHLPVIVLTELSRKGENNHCFKELDRIIPLNQNIDKACLLNRPFLQTHCEKDREKASLLVKESNHNVEFRIPLQFDQEKLIFT